MLTYGRRVRQTNLLILMLGSMWISFDRGFFEADEHEGGNTLRGKMLHQMLCVRYRSSNLSEGACRFFRFLEQMLLVSSC